MPKSFGDSPIIVLGIETSCDECSIALVRNGREILSMETASQIRAHQAYKGVVPEIASRRHIEDILPVFNTCLQSASQKFEIEIDDIDGIGVTNRPGLSGSLAVGLNFAKGLSFALNKPFIAIDHIMAHLYAAQLDFDIDYPYIGLIVSGGHSLIAIVDSYCTMQVLGASIDDSCGEAFDKVAAHFGLGYPGGKIIDTIAENGYTAAYKFPFANLHKRGYNYDVSFSGLKNAVINQRDTFWDGTSEKSLENILASFQRVAIDSLLEKLDMAVNDTGIDRIVAGGGVVANRYLRQELQKRGKTYFPSPELCTDNAAMIAGIATRYLQDGKCSSLNCGLTSRVSQYKRF